MQPSKSETEEEVKNLTEDNKSEDPESEAEEEESKQE